MRTASTATRRLPAGRFDDLHGDEDFREYSRAEEERIEREARRLVRENLTDALWWDQRLEGVSPLSSEVPAQLARMMGNLDPACRGERIALDAITTALVILRRQAQAEAAAEARLEAERALEAGDL